MASKSTKAPSMQAQEARWMAEDDLRTLQRAAEIRKDPKRLKKARALAREQLAALKAVATKD